jgi:predicted nucleic acid-binding protein
MELWLRNFVILPYDNDTARAWAQIMVERKSKGQPVSAQDAWVAACALRHNCPLITHNVKDFKGITGLIVISEPAP